MKGSEVGDSIHGHRIIAEARKVSDPVVIVKSGGADDNDLGFE